MSLSDVDKAWIRRQTESPEKEAQWVELLSLLEYVGCRKIMKALSFENVTTETLRHVSEEASHAYLLRAAAERMGRVASWERNPLALKGWKYFQSLDREISARVENQTPLAYPAVSWAIERRVLVVYPFYLETTGDSGVRNTLKQILAQEKRHATLFDDCGLPIEVREAAAEIERKLWVEFTSHTTHLP